MPYANPFAQGPQPSGNPFINPFNPTAAPNDVDYYFNQVPQAGYSRQLYEWNPEYYYGVSPRATFAQNQYSDYSRRFAAEAANDPTQEWYPWLKRQPDPGLAFDLQSPDQRGEGNYRLYTPRSRWVIGGS